MHAIYPAKYSDRMGEELTTITNDGKILSIVLRGIEFRGDDFDALEPPNDADPSVLSSFCIHRNELCSCVIDAEIPVPIVTPHTSTEGILSVHLELGEPAPNGGLDREGLSLRLAFGDRVFTSKGRSGYFEDELGDLQKQMPEGTYLRACIICAFSDYSPLGHGLYGALACFRDNKQGYLSIQSKRDLFGVWGTMTEYVQETFLCSEFERRAPGTGYRG
jgi:hypothetical protein